VAARERKIQKTLHLLRLGEAWFSLFGQDMLSVVHNQLLAIEPQD